MKSRIQDIEEEKTIVYAMDLKFHHYSGVSLLVNFFKSRRPRCNFYFKTLSVFVLYFMMAQTSCVPLFCLSSLQKLVSYMRCLYLIHNWVVWICFFSNIIIMQIKVLVARLFLDSLEMVIIPMDRAGNFVIIIDYDYYCNTIYDRYTE